MLALLCFRCKQAACPFCLSGLADGHSAFLEGWLDGWFILGTACIMNFTAFGVLDSFAFRFPGGPVCQHNYIT